MYNFSSCNEWVGSYNEWAYASRLAELVHYMWKFEN